MDEFKQYRRVQIAEMRPVTQQDINHFKANHCILSGADYDVSISDTDLQNGSPKLGDMIARNPKNHNDQCLVAEQYFKDNFEELT